MKYLEYVIRVLFPVVVTNIMRHVLGVTLATELIVIAMFWGGYLWGGIDEICKR